MYFTVASLLYFKQSDFVYYPNDQDFFDCPDLSDYEKITHKETRFYYKENNSKIIVYYHGNAGSACDRDFLAPTLGLSDTSILFVEYAGYSADSNEPSQKAILQDVNNIQNFLERENYSHISIIGTSLGSGAASYHASITPPENLILITPFSSMLDMAKQQFPFFPVTLLLKERYPNDTWLKNFSGRLLVIHGNNDKIIPQALSEKLYHTLSKPKKYYTIIEGAGHNNLFDYQETYTAIHKFLNSENPYE